MDWDESEAEENAHARIILEVSKQACHTYR